MNGELMVMPSAQRSMRGFRAVEAEAGVWNDQAHVASEAPLLLRRALVRPRRMAARISSRYYRIARELDD